MIEKLPGWANFFVLMIFYLAVMLAEYYLLLVMFRWFGFLGAYLDIMAHAYAGGYLAKWREKQGGGWVFW